jgi:hypothetical protein
MRVAGDHVQRLPPTKRLERAYIAPGHGNTGCEGVAGIVSPEVVLAASE